MKIENLLPIWHQNYNKSAWQALIGFTFCLMLPQVNAAVVTKDIIVGMGVTHDSNPSMAEFNKEPVWIYTIAPELNWMPPAESIYGIWMRLCWFKDTQTRKFL